jgi:hypothetical protein
MRASDHAGKVRRSHLRAPLEVTINPGFRFTPPGALCRRSHSRALRQERVRAQTLTPKIQVFKYSEFKLQDQNPKSKNPKSKIK